MRFILRKKTFTRSIARASFLLLLCRRWHKKNALRDECRNTAIFVYTVWNSDNNIASRTCDIIFVLGVHYSIDFGNEVCYSTIRKKGT